MAVFTVAVQRALALPEVLGWGQSGAFGVDWPFSGSYDQAFANTEAI